MNDISQKNERLAGMPRQFQKSFFKELDTQFLVILLCCLLAEVLVVYTMSRQPLTEYSQKEISRIQERFAQFILQETPETDPAADQPAAAGGGAGEGADEAEKEDGADAGESAAETGAGDEAAGEVSAEVRHANRRAEASAQRETMSRQVSSKGLLGLLSASGGTASGESVTDVLGGTAGGSGSDLDEVLRSSDGLKTSGTSGLSGGGGGTGVRGGRTGTGAATIDDLVSDKGGYTTQSLSRSGELQVESPADVAGRGHKSIYRSGQELQRVIYEHYSAIKYCYERELKRHPSLKGKVTVRITVNPDGHVSDVQIVNSTLDNERTERCILTRIRRWKDFKPIDKDQGDVTFSQAFNFGY